jgi:PAS domain S-box-containing protein
MSRGEAMAREAKSIPARDAGSAIDITKLSNADDPTGDKNNYRYEAEALALVRDAIILTDNDLRIRFWNVAAEKIYGHTAQQAVGQVLDELLETQSQVPLRSILEHVSATGYWSGELTNQCSDGRRISVECQWRLCGDDHDKRRGFILASYPGERIGSDIRLREAANYLVQQRQWLEAVLNLLPLPMLLVDPAGDRITFRNQAAQAFASVEDEEVFSANHFTDMDGRTLSHDELPTSRAARGEKLLGHQIRWRRPDGERTLMIHSATLPAMHSHESVAVLLYQDVTRDKEHERELRRANQAKDALLAMLGHELRNPLAAITSAAELIQLLDPSNPTFDEARDILNTHIRHLVRLVDDMLDVSRLTSGKIRLRRETVDLRDVVSLSLQSCETTFGARRQVVRVSLPDQPVYVNGDAARLEQVVVNLLTNAAKYTDESGTIKLSLNSDQEGHAEVRIRDNGIGISPEMLPQIFEMFRQLNPSLHRAEGGLGIGLSVVKSLVELHGGSVVALSDGVGRGSEFVVLLPLSESQQAAWNRPANISPSCSPGGLRVLVVEDNVDVAHTVMALLAQAGHKVEVTYDGPSALSAVHSFHPQVAFLDIGLPGMSGLELASAFRNDPELREIRLIALTGFGQAEDRRRSMEAGFDEHLVKPVSYSKLNEVLAAYAPANSTGP